MTLPPTDLPDADAETRRATALALGVAVATIALKAFALGASGSVTVLASLTESALHLVALLATVIAVRRAGGAIEGDRSHDRREAMAALVQAGLVCASAVFVGWEAVRRIFDPRPVDAGVWAVGAILASIVLSAWLARERTKGAKVGNSPGVAGDRGQHVADLAAGGVVLIGVASGAFLDAPGLDAAAGLVLAVWLFWGGSGLLKTATDRLVDRPVSDADQAAITAAVLADPRIMAVRRSHAHRSGATLTIRKHVDLDPTLSLEAAHAIVVEAQDRVRAVFPEAKVAIQAGPGKGDGRPQGPAPTSVPLT